MYWLLCTARCPMSQITSIIEVLCFRCGNNLVHGFSRLFMENCHFLYRGLEQRCSSWCECQLNHAAVILVAEDQNLTHVQCIVTLQLFDQDCDRACYLNHLYFLLWRPRHTCAACLINALSWWWSAPQNSSQGCVGKAFNKDLLSICLEFRMQPCFGWIWDFFQRWIAFFLLSSLLLEVLHLSAIHRSSAADLILSATDLDLRCQNNLFLSLHAQHFKIRQWLTYICT